ncbi:NAD(P)/FAD-dependent oxidoreductase [Streptomyces bicolor]|uniref:NAD(P)/FAD-dependent oxidoreductase n=1 Tax=Streptomyces bicolor TaxID=66874 RepID=UPI0004E23023|nr:FAD-dependent oxidoreductase [Streptomyces bicolor]
MSVVVVGAGIVGASVAYHLARRGAPVTLIDRAPAPATGATGGSFAWIGGRGGHWPGGAEDLRGSVLADHRRLEAELPDVAVRWSGSLRWDGAPVGAEPGEGRFRVGADGIRALEPGLREPPEWAVHTPSDGGLDAVAVTGALVRAARGLGARMVLGAAGVALKTVDGRVLGVTSSAGFHPASTVVLAAGTGVRGLLTPLGLELPIEASPARLVRLTAPSGLVRAIVAGPEFEVREVREGRLLMTVPPTSSADRALRRLQASFHGADGCRVLDTRVSARPMPADGPLVGHLVPDGSVYLAVLHSAVTLAPTVGRLVAQELVTGESAEELRRCRPEGRILRGGG